MFLFQNRQIAINLKDRDMNLYCRLPYKKNCFVLHVASGSKVTQYEPWYELTWFVCSGGAAW